MRISIEKYRWLCGVTKVIPDHGHPVQGHTGVKEVQEMVDRCESERGMSDAGTWLGIADHSFEDNLQEFDPCMSLEDIVISLIDSNSHSQRKKYFKHKIDLIRQFVCLIHYFSVITSERKITNTQYIKKYIRI